jgi:hypothetical protein
MYIEKEWFLLKRKLNSVLYFARVLPWKASPQWVSHPE